MKNSWQNALIKPESTIREALEIINSEALRMAMVVTEKQRLIGVVTDGDIRRALLRNLTLNDSVTEIMNMQPVVAPKSAKKDELIDIMRKLDVFTIPLVDEQGIVIGLETLHGALRQPKYKNPVLIMAGGFGTRLHPLTQNCPKPMLKIGNKPMLETLIRNFIRAGFENFYISTHYMPELIQDYFKDGKELGINITYLYEEEPLGTAGALGLLPDDIPTDQPILMINGDILTNINFQKLIEFHTENEADATMCVREYEYQVPYGVINGKEHKILGIVEKPVQRFFVNAGIYVVSPKIVQELEKNKRIDMPSLLEERISRQENVMMFPIHEYWLDVGRMDDFQKAQIDILSMGMN